MKKIALILIFFLTVGTIFFVFNKKNQIDKNNKNFNAYIEEDGSYVASTVSKISGKGYVLNTSLSSCTNGGTFAQNAQTGALSVTTTKESKCTFYVTRSADIAYNRLHTLNNNIVLKTSGFDARYISPETTELSDRGFYTDNETTVSISSANQSRYITYASSYTINNSTKKFTLVNPQTAQWNSIYTTLISGDYYTGQTSVRSESSNYSYNNVNNIYKIAPNSTVSSLVLYKNKIPGLVSWNDTQVGLFKTTDNYGDTYFFRGNIDNNYFKFGKNSNNQDMWWRILRINGDGSIRLMYNGTSAHDNDEKSTDKFLSSTKFNNDYNDNAYVGYMYGNFTAPSTSYEQAHANEVDSNLKTYIDNWYVNNIYNTGYSQYLADSLFCNERRTSDNSLAFGQNAVTYLGYTSAAPKYTCPQKNDAFTVDDVTYGNGALTKPIATLTADDIAYAGARGDLNYYFFIYNGYQIWTLTPHNFHVNNYAYFRTFNSYGNLNSTNTVNTTSNYVVPVISIKTDYINSIQGAGTKASPFYIQTS